MLRHKAASAMPEMTWGKKYTVRKNFQPLGFLERMILRRPERLKGCGLAALAAVKCFNRHHSICIQLVGAVAGLLPVFRRVVVP